MHRDLALQLYRHLRHSRLFRVAVFGGVGVLVQTLAFESLAFWLDLVRPSIATLIGAELGVLTSFALNNRFSFNDRVHAPLAVRLLRFHAVVSGSLFVQWCFVYLTELVTHDWLAIHAAYALGIAAGFILNYTGYRLWVWRHQPHL